MFARRIAVVGTGYVGLTSGACLASLGHTVVCADIDEAKVARLSQGEVDVLDHLTGLPPQHLVDDLLPHSRIDGEPCDPSRPPAHDAVAREMARRLDLHDVPETKAAGAANDQAGVIDACRVAHQADVEVAGRPAADLDDHRIASMQEMRSGSSSLRRR